MNIKGRNLIVLALLASLFCGSASKSVSALSVSANSCNHVVSANQYSPSDESSIVADLVSNPSDRARASFSLNTDGTWTLTSSDGGWIAFNVNGQDVEFDQGSLATTPDQRPILTNVCGSVHVSWKGTKPITVITNWLVYYPSR